MSALRPAIEPSDTDLIVTAASEAYSRSLLALLGSLNVNWPSHPPVVVYDLGLGDDVSERIRRSGYEVRTVAPFCPHWRRHFAWKIWCWNDAPADRFLWLDAGIAVLAPLDEVFESIKRLGYFVVPTYHPLTENASLAACRGCGVTADFRQNRMTFAGGIIGFDRAHPTVGPLLESALELARVEEYLRATEPLHRHDQALVSLLLHREFGHPTCSDGMVYGGWTTPRQVHCQKLWVHRRAMREDDLAYFARHINLAGAPRIPGEPVHPGRLQRGLTSIRRNVLGARASLGRARQVASQLITGRWPASQRGPGVYDGVRD